MFRGHRIAAILAAAAMVTLLMMPQVWAADQRDESSQQQNNAPKERTTQPADQADRPADADKRIAMQRQIDRASQLIGMNVQDTAGKSVGEIEDLVVEERSGRIAYVALRYDQTLGFGGKLAAIPPRALTITQNGDEKQIRLTKSAADLKSAPSIDANNWPDASDQTWRKQVDEFYDARTQSRVGGERPDAGLADVRRDDAGLDRPTADAKLHQRDQRGSEVGPDAGRAKVAGADQAMPGQSYRVSQIIGLSVQARDTTVARAGEPDVGAQADAADKPQQDETIGKIRDVLINRQAHRAMFVLVDYGGTLGVGEETAVAPFASFSFTRQQDAQALTMAQLNANHNALKQNRITNDQDVNALAQSDRARQVFQSYDQTPYWETFGYEAAEEPRGQLDKHDRSKTDTERTRDQLDKYKQDRSDRPERPESSPDQSNQ